MTVLEYFERRQAMKNGEGYPDPTAGQAAVEGGREGPPILLRKEWLRGEL